MEKTKKEGEEEEAVVIRVLQVKARQIVVKKNTGGVRARTGPRACRAS